MRILFLLFCTLSILVSGCGIFPFFEFEDKGEFQTDEAMIEFFGENLNDFNLIVDNRIECNESYSEDENNDYPVFCGEFKRKLKLVRITNRNDSLSLRTFYFDRKSFWNDYEKGYYYNGAEVDSSLIWDGDFNTRPKRDDCDNYFRLKPINLEGLSQGWYLYISTFCD